MVNKKLCKIISIAIIIIFTIVCLQNIVYAGNQPTVINEINTATETETEMDQSFFSIGGMIDGLVGFVTMFFRIPFLLIAMGIQALFTGVANLGGSSIQGMLTPDDLFYNRVGLTNIDFFDMTAGGAINVIRTNVATWYYVLRIFAIIILLAVLVYIGIRMAISTVASEQAQYKRMLMDWAVSFALIFFLGYIILFTLEANNAFLKMLETTVNNKIGNGVALTLIETTIIGGATSSWAALLVYIMLVGMTLTFLFAYIKRMLTIGFLIIISPLITITYSIDKVKDGKAQALNTWLKEFMLTVLIQPFHCIIYTVFVSATIDLIAQQHNLASMVLAIMSMAFIWQAEKIVKKIFGFDAASTSLGETVASAVIVKDIGKAATTLASNAGKAASHTSFGRNINQRINSNATLSSIRNTVNNNPQLKNTLNSVDSLSNKLISGGMSVAAGASAAAFEAGLGTPASSMQVGLETYKTTKAYMDATQNREGSRRNIELSQNELQRCADLVSRNDARYTNYRTDPTAKTNLKQDCANLITRNMAVMEGHIQAALRDLMTSDPARYNLNTAQGIANIQKIQDAALDTATDFTNGATNPVHGTGWSTEEQAVVKTIQMRNLAQAVQNAHGHYQAAGYQNPGDEIDNFIDTLT